MNVVHLFTGVTGRIPRRLYWLGFAAVVVIFGLGRYVLKYHLGASELAVVIWSAWAAIPLTALSVKRFNDRDRPVWIGYVVGASVVLFIVAPYFGYLTEDVGRYSAAEHIIFWVLVAISVFSFVDNGFLRGTVGRNRYGPDPIAGRE